MIGGGATGLGVALDAAARGLTVALVEAGDFAKGTSSRSTKLVHGGVRYLAQGNVRLVREALRERAILLRNAPHLVQPLPFLVPVYGVKGRWLDQWFYGAGLMLYDRLAGERRLGRAELLSAAAGEAADPGPADARLSAGPCATGTPSSTTPAWRSRSRAPRVARGAAVLNHCAAVALTHEAGRIAGVVVEDRESRQRWALRSRCVVNATGVWVDTVRRMDAGAARRPRGAEPGRSCRASIGRSCRMATRS